MDTFYFMAVALCVAGAALVVGPLFLGRENSAAKEREEEQDAILAYMNKKAEVEKQLDEVDDALEEIHGTSQSVLKEIDAKYQELLFLYNLIDDKSKSLQDPSESAAKRPRGAAGGGGGGVGGERVADYSRAIPRAHIDVSTTDAASLDVTVGELRKKLFKHPKLTKILEMRKSGMNDAAIAKELNVGQGEITLILRLADGESVGGAKSGVGR